jgi:two-component system sensor histidine kinase DesK
MDEPAMRTAFLWFGSLLVLGLLVTLTLGQVGTATAVYVTVAAMMLFSFPVAATITVVIAMLVVVTGEVVPGWDRSLGLAFSVCAASLAVFGVRTMLRRNIDLVRANEENAELLVENERTRFARDLHDILGHSLTVITVKAELAGRLMDTDPVRAKAEVADLERLSRDALADVRRAVEGYRDLTLPGELARARAALEAAEIRADLPNSTDEVPSDLRELFAWTVREGVTNVIRHSHARSCRVVIRPSGVEVTDDGDGAPTGAASGSGLHGLRERAAAVGATVVTRSLSPGFSLSVVRT